MSTMNTNHMLDYGQLLQIGGLEDPSMFYWGDDMSKELEMADLTSSANVNIWEPSKEMASSLMSETPLPGMENDLDLTLLDLDLTNLLSVPDSPYSEDSGIWSPGSENSPASPQDCLSNLCESEDKIVNLAPTNLECSTLLSTSHSLDFPHELPISVSDTAELHSLGPFDTTSADAGAAFDGGNIQITTIDILPPPQKCQQSIAPGKSRSSTKTKSLSPQQKRERKKEQNKNAATRYREKKRAEGESIMKIQIGLEEKNKEFKDKVSQVTREIQYLKELLIEVYRTKGIIE